MKITVKEVDDDGTVTVTGVLNAVEHQYLIQFAINGLMAMGATMALEENPQDEEGNDKLRIKFNGNNPIQ